MTLPARYSGTCPECGEVGWENNLARHRSKHARFTITPKEDR